MVVDFDCVADARRYHMVFMLAFSFEFEQFWRFGGIASFFPLSKNYNYYCAAVIFVCDAQLHRYTGTVQDGLKYYHSFCTQHVLFRRRISMEQQLSGYFDWGAI